MSELRPLESPKRVPGLRYYPDSRPGIKRQRRGRGFSYISPDGTRIDDPKERRRLAALAVPPAYENVWISPLDNGHLLATGYDARTRKQYKYHPDWTEFRANRKYEKLAEFGTALPGIRKAVAKGLRAEAGDRDFALAALVSMLDRYALRIGSPDATAQNKTYGATTLRSRHLRKEGSKIKLTFTAKGGHRVSETLDDAKLNKVLHKVDDLPGAELFSWLDENDTPQPLKSEQVNAFLAEAAGQAGITAKDFRTWNGTLAAFNAAVDAEDRDLTIKELAEAAAERLHNTPSIARSSYIHPAVIDLCDLDPGSRKRHLAALKPGRKRGLRKGEDALLAFLETT